MNCVFCEDKMEYVKMGGAGVYCKTPTVRKAL